MENHEVALSMTIMNNLQAMERIIEPCKPYTFKMLRNKTYKELQTIQDETITLYNDALREGDKHANN